MHRKIKNCIRNTLQIHFLMIKNKNILAITYLKVSFFLVFLITSTTAQLILPADPYGLIKHERRIYIENDNNLLQTTLRPQMNKINNQWLLKVRSELFYNNGAPNLENMGNRLIGKGTGLFTGINLSYSGKFVSFTVEPFYFTTQNKDCLLYTSDAADE